MTTMTVLHQPMFPAFAGTGNQALLDALAALPDYSSQEAAKTRVSRAMGEASSALLAATQGHLALVQRVTDAARADKPMPKGLPDQAAETRRELGAAQALVDVLREAAQQLSQARDQILSEAPAALLSHLAGQLAETLTEARTLGLADVASAQEAIDAGLVGQWQSYLDLTSRHAEIRSAQSLVTAHLVGGDLASQHLSTFGQVRNYAEVFPAWHARTRGQAIGTVNGEPVYDNPPWDEYTPDGLWSYAVRHHDVDLWVPTGRQMRDAYTTAVTEARDLENAQAREDQGLPLTASERERLNIRAALERQYLDKNGALK